MKPILRNIGSVIAGFVVASLIMMVVESINGHVLYPGLAKAAEGVTDRETIRKIFATAPIGSLLVVIIGWGLGGFTGGWVTSIISVRSATTPGYVLCALLTLAGLANNLMLPPPAWYWVFSLVVMAGSTIAGARFASQSNA
jgi:hypothetical protein